MKTLGIIPARYASTRFPGKPLVDLAGKSMIHRVYDQCKKASTLDQVIVATDDKRIFDHVKSWNGEIMMTSVDHNTGTSRVAEVAAKIKDADIIVNIQGDEPTISPFQIDELIKISGKGISTQAKIIDSDEDLFNPNVVKVVFDKKGRALLFSRQAIPFIRNTPKENWRSQNDFYQHVGIYSFDRETLLHLESIAPSNLEKLESLEQLRWLDHGIPIRVGITTYKSISIDTPEDVDKVRKNLGSK